MLTSPHPTDHELLMAVDGELSGRRRRSIDRHVSTCASCCSRLGQLQLTLANARAVYESAFDSPAPSYPSSRLRLELALQEAATEWNPSRLVRLRRALGVSGLRVGLGLAAVAVLLAMIRVPPRSAEAVRTPEFSPGSSLPIAALTPGAVAVLTAGELCEGARPSRLVSSASRERVLRDYGMSSAAADSYELDALITPELGGTTDRANLWPQLYESPVWNARVKDQLEDLLPRLVCSNQIALAQAQQDIATDWIAAYKRHFKTDRPLRAHLIARLDDDDDLVFAPAPTQVVAENAAPRIPNVTFARWP